MVDYHSSKDASPIPDGAVVYTSTTMQRVLDCQRKHLYQDVLGRGRVQTRSFTLGSILHACLERHLLCPTGVVPDPKDLPAQPQRKGRYLAGSVLAGQQPGAAVDLFPEFENYPAEAVTRPLSWYRHRERDGGVHSINDYEQAWVRAVVEQSIKEGHAAHLPYGRVEQRFNLPVGVTSTGREVWYTSLIDYGSIEALTVVDHKTTKDWIWCQTPESLGNNSQIITYGLATALEAGILNRPDLRVSLVHSVYRKTVVGWRPGESEPKNYYRRVEAIDPFDGEPGVRVSSLRLLWDSYRKAMMAQANLIESAGITSENDPAYLEIPGPNHSDACSKYGGCPSFMRCSVGTPDYDFLSGY